MGAPNELAENYRQTAHYLISPRVYEDYIRVIKFLVPTIGVLVAATGAVMGAVESYQPGWNYVSKLDPHGHFGSTSSTSLDNHSIYRLFKNQRRLEPQFKQI